MTNRANCPGLSEITVRDFPKSLSATYRNRCPGLSETRNLSPLAQKLGAWMARQCVDGLPAHVDEGLANAFPGVEAKQIKLALAELKAYGRVELNSVIAYLDRVGAIKTVGALASDPWHAVFLSISDETLPFVRSKS